MRPRNLFSTFTFVHPQFAAPNSERAHVMTVMFSFGKQQSEKKAELDGVCFQVSMHSSLTERSQAIANTTQKASPAARATGLTTTTTTKHCTG